MEAIKSQLASGSSARLIPVVADSKKEERATSVVLAAFTVVPEFARSILESVGAPVGKRSNVQCLTEVTFKNKELSKKRPDGLIILTSGSKTWSALIESKIAGAELDATQIEDYLDIAKQQGLDAVITISNQFAALPTHHPVTVSKQKTRSVGLYHFSWLAIIAEALLILDNKSVDDIEQAYILRELVRYLRHDSSGVRSTMKMQSSWRALTDKVFQRVHLSKNDPDLQAAVANWHQLQKYLTLQLSVSTGSTVAQKLSRAHSKDSNARIDADVAEILKSHEISSVFSIPNAAGDLELLADMQRKSITISMRVGAPKDRSRTTASINWLMRQLKAIDATDILVRADWPKRIPTTTLALQALLDDPAGLLAPNVKELPVSFEIVKVIDLGGKFKSSAAFVEQTESELVGFYKSIGQNLTKWAPKPPKVKEQTVITDEIVDIENEVVPPTDEVAVEPKAIATSNPWLVQDL